MCLCWVLEKKKRGTLLPLWLLRCRFRLRYWVCRHGRGKKSTYDRYCISFFEYFITLAQLNIFLRRHHKVNEFNNTAALHPIQF